MNELSGPPPMPETGAGGMDCGMARLLRMSRGFSCIFWGLLLIAAMHGVAMVSDISARWRILAFWISFLPLVGGLWMLRACGELTPRWRRQISRVSLLGFAAIYLCPFLVWWNIVPTKLYFSVNTGVFILVMIGVLVELNRLAGESARWMSDVSLRRESTAGWGMVLWLSGCTVCALVWLYYHAGVLDAGMETVLIQISSLPREARTLFLLPYAMTAYVMWRAKETGFRRTVRTAG